MKTKLFRGVWFAECPLDAQDSIKGTTVLSVEIPEAEIASFEIEKGHDYREWCIPAEVVNRYGPPTVHDDDFAGSTEEAIVLRVSRLRASTARQAIAEADALEARLPFLRAHGLLGPEDGEE
jgi:hypothetical protein